MSYPRRNTRITYEGLSFLSILAFIILGSIMRQINLLVLLSGLMIAPFLFNWRISRKMLERLRFRRILPKWAHAGTPFVIEWEVHNDRTRVTSWDIKISDAIAAEAAGRKEIEKIDIILPQIEPQDSASSSYRCLLAARGIYYFGPATASSAFPIGLVKSRSALTEQDSLVVAPRLGRLTPRWQRLTQSSAVGVRSNRRRLGLSNDEFYAIRPWRPGDPRRVIHWRSTAKRGELLVKQYDERTDHDFGIVLDLYADQSTPPERVETAVSFMATVISRLHQQIKGDTVVGILGDVKWVAEDRMTRFLQSETMRRLATIQPSEETDVANQIRLLLDSTSRDMSIIVISTRPSLNIDRIGQADAIQKGLVWIDLSSPQGQSYFQLDLSGGLQQLVRTTAAAKTNLSGIT